MANRRSHSRSSGGRSVCLPLQHCRYRQAHVILGEDKFDAHAQNTEQNRGLVQRRPIRHRHDKNTSSVIYAKDQLSQCVFMSEEACIRCQCDLFRRKGYEPIIYHTDVAFGLPISFSATLQHSRIQTCAKQCYKQDHSPKPSQDVLHVQRVD
jgi:hypothetical protein